MTIAQRQVRALRSDDLPGCLALTEDRGWAYPERRWAFLFATGELYGIDGPDGGLAGAVLLTRYGSRLAGIGTMLVANRYARRGFGSALLSHVLEQVGDTTVFLYATAYGQPLYEKFGFHAIGRSVTLRGRFRPEPGAAPDVTRRAEPADLAAIRRLDAEVFGADRSRLLGPLADYAEELRVIERGGRITGFAATTPGRGMSIIGPLIAQDDTDARALIRAMNATLARRYGDWPMRANLDPARAELADWFAQRGLPAGEVTSFMVRGDPELPGDRGRLYLPVLTALG